MLHLMPSLHATIRHANFDFAFTVQIQCNQPTSAFSLVHCNFIGNELQVWAVDYLSLHWEDTRGGRDLRVGVVTWKGMEVTI